MTHVMIDLETLSTANNALILSIGAVKFALGGTEMGPAFYVRVNMASAQQFGLHISADTVQWWLAPERDDARRDLLIAAPVDLPDALNGFTQWLGDEEIEGMWGNGAAFDNVILRSAYNATGIEPPWSYSKDRCYRTMKALVPEIPLERVGVYHNAVDDARTQAAHLQKIMRKTVVIQA